MVSCSHNWCQWHSVMNGEKKASKNCLQREKITVHRIKTNIKTVTTNLYKNNIIKQLLLKWHSSLHSKNMKEHFLRYKPWKLGDSGRVEMEFTQSRECQHSQISQGAKSYTVCRLGLWSMTSDLETDAGFVLFALISHFLWHVRFNTFPPHARRSNTAKYLSWVSSEIPCLQLVVQFSLIYRTSSRYFSYNPFWVQNIPHTCFEASKECSCISTVSVLPAIVYVTRGVCRARQ